MAFAYQNFDQISIDFPYKGMNRDISPPLLPDGNAWYLENFTQDSLGNGLLRYGIKDFAQLSAVEDGFILRSFPFVAHGGVEQVISYVNVFQKDDHANTFTFDPDHKNSLSFVSASRENYRNNTFIKLKYLDRDENVIVQKVWIRNVVLGLNNRISFEMPEVSLDVTLDFSPTVQEISFSTGELYRLIVSTRNIQKIYEGLRVDCIPRAVPFVQKLILCNGLDPLLEWNGDQISVIFEWVKEKASNIAKHGDHTLRFTCNLNPHKYLTATSVFFNAHEFQIANKTVADNSVTLTLTEPVGHLPVQIFYKAFPPRCNFLYVAQDRLWGLGQGAAGIEFRSPEEAMAVYRTDRPNLTNSWVEEETQAYKYLDLSNKHGVVDNLEAIAQAGSRLVFAGREKTQVYSGLVAGNTFGWESTVSSGTIHGDLVFELANDIFFINAGGLHSFSTLNIGNQFAATTITAINALLKDQVINALQSNVTYRSSFVFIYNLGAFLGIRIGGGLLNHALFSTQPYFFSIFSGDFEASHIFPLGNKLFLVKERSFLVYGDGRDGSDKVFSDRDKPIVGAWHQPFNQKFKNYFSSYRVSCLADYSNAFLTTKGNGVSLDIFNERPKTSSVKKRILLKPRKEVLEGKVGDIEFNGTFKTLARKLKSRGTESWIFLSVTALDSFFSLKKVLLYGRKDR